MRDVLYREKNGKENIDGTRFVRKGISGRGIRAQPLCIAAQSTTVGRDSKNLVDNNNNNNHDQRDGPKFPSNAGYPKRIDARRSGDGSGALSVQQQAAARSSPRSAPTRTQRVRKTIESRAAAAAAASLPQSHSWRSPLSELTIENAPLRRGGLNLRWPRATGRVLKILSARRRRLRRRFEYKNIT